MYYFRHPSRRTSMTRRIADRRETPYPFGSPEWIENIKKHYLVWPQSNRRETGKCANDRRTVERRHQPFGQRHSEKKYSMPLLTPDERKLIEDLYLDDDVD